MIKIYPPKTTEEKGEFKIASVFESEGHREELWFSFPSKFREYAVTEQLDAFVVGLLFLGLKTGQDIEVCGKLSARLYYAINHYLINALCLANTDYKKIKVEAHYLSTINLNLREISGTGLSCGVDSFATYYDHLNSKPPFAIEYFTFFNVGSHGDFGGENARRIFSERFGRVKTCANELGKEIIKFDSNLSEVLRMNFQQTHSLRSISCVLVIQKLFRNYYYASSIRFDQFKLDKIRIAEYDLINLQMLSTESTTLWSSALQYTRPERLNFIADFALVSKYLDVCTNPYVVDRKKINCSRCDKCIRTMLLLDFYDKLDRFHKVFDLEEYQEKRQDFVAHIRAKRNKETQDYQLLNLLKTKGYINYKVKTRSAIFRVHSELRKIKKVFK